MCPAAYKERTFTHRLPLTHGECFSAKLQRAVLALLLNLGREQSVCFACPVADKKAAGSGRVTQGD